ncbi:uncharacterized protein LY89DRAFT_676666 [Mollisia scopiformis]|uniref:Uncharacterized protein n=1 Tax=Mollisia scopiformis TaxID=149040 RepID=A0A132B8N2_MOLSC|nr:uncharacterized protein LY89DRAFT_676666 [Mollisia scopiformis]KUJ08770.1 hypothetical protein LY89DRAFT_676666 [Mollisia scopiformis]
MDLLYPAGVDMQLCGCGVVYLVAMFLIRQNIRLTWLEPKLGPGMVNKRAQVEAGGVISGDGKNRETVTEQVVKEVAGVSLSSTMFSVVTSTLGWKYKRRPPGTVCSIFTHRDKVKPKTACFDAMQIAGRGAPTTT